jgi:hypothetical protein
MRVVMMMHDARHPIVRCVVMGSDSLDSFDIVNDAVVSTVKAIQNSFEYKVRVQFVFPAKIGIRGQGWVPFAGVPALVFRLTNSWVDEWADANADFSPIVHALLMEVGPSDEPRGETELLQASRNLDKNEIDSLFRLEESFGFRSVSPLQYWAETVFDSSKWDVFLNLSDDDGYKWVDPEFALTIHHKGTDEQTLLLEDAASRAGVQVHAFASDDRGVRRIVLH